VFLIVIAFFGYVLVLLLAAAGITRCRRHVARAKVPYHQLQEQHDATAAMAANAAAAASDE
jgi:hypothetical protein